MIRRLIHKLLFALILGGTFLVYFYSKKTVLKLSEDERIDWHDYDFIKYEATRSGPGEMSPYILNDANEIEQNEKSILEYGASIVVSRKLSLTRALPDPRHVNCLDKKYLRKLPTVSVIVIFYNEPLSILLRCVSSIYYRSPKELLHEIVLVNDNSTDPDLYEPLRNYVEENFNGRVKVFNNPSRLGLIVTRMEGAKRATGEVILFLDSHMEVTTNWLPPLLDPIAMDPKTATVPNLDSINHKDFKYQMLSDNWNGGFDWNLRYNYYLFTNEEYPVRGENHLLSAMTGGAYAINREYFFELGGYDTGMFLYNGENYELSFKLHLCGGTIVKVPCSRIGHMSKSKVPYSRQMNGINHEMRNLRRVVEVWFDEYKHLFYRHHPERLNIDFGDISKQVAKRESLNCKPFKYYLEVIAPFILDRFPIEEKPHFAYGAIQSVAQKKWCVSHLHDVLGLVECGKNLTHPEYHQHFLYTWKRTLEPNNEYDYCLTFTTLSQCLYRQGNQMFRYHLDTQQIENSGTNKCLTADFDLKTITLEKCDIHEDAQKWDFGYKNITALKDWENVGIKILPE